MVLDHVRRNCPYRNWINSEQDKRRLLDWRQHRVDHEQHAVNRPFVHAADEFVTASAVAAARLKMYPVHTLNYCTVRRGQNAWQSFRTTYSSDN